MPAANPKPAPAVAIGPAAPWLPVELWSAAISLALVDAGLRAEVVEDAPALETEIDEPDEPDELDELDGAVDDALAPHEACVGTLTPYALQRPLASVMIAETRLSVR